MLLPLLCRTKSDFLDLPGEALLSQETKLAKSSEKQFEDTTPKWSASPNFSEEQVEFSHLRQFRRTAQMRGLLQIQMESIMPDL
jgi:hypothetical protein